MQSLRVSVLCLLLCSLLAAASAEDSYRYESEADLDDVEVDLDEASNLVDAVDKAVGGKGDDNRYRAPAIVPRESLNEFARELNRVKSKLQTLVKTIEPSLKKHKARVDKLKKKAQSLKKRVAELQKQIAEHIRRAKAENKKKYAKKHAELKKKLAAFKKSREWLSGLNDQLSNLKPNRPGDALYESALADITKSLADNADIAEEMTGIDVVSELQELTAPRADFDADAASDLEVSNVKMYETERLNSLSKRMREALEKKIKKLEEQIKALHRVTVPAHLHVGLRDAQDNLRRVQRRLARAQGKYAEAKRADGPKLAAAKRELAKIARIEGNLYASGK